MENDLQMMLLRHFLHDYHKHHVLVYCPCGITIQRSTLELIGSHLIMTSLEKNSKLICFSLEILHERAHARRNGTEVMVFQLLVLG